MNFVMNRRFYIENPDGTTEPAADPLAWEYWWAHADRRVAFDDCGPLGEASTVFLGCDHQWATGGPPLLYETMVFGGPLDGETRRYPTRAEAAAGHAAMVERMRELARDSV